MNTNQLLYNILDGLFPNAFEFGQKEVSYDHTQKQVSKESLD